MVETKDTIEYWNESAPKLWKARSRLYRSQILQPNTHFAAFFEIYKIIKLDFRFLHFFNAFALFFCFNDFFFVLFRSNCKALKWVFSFRSQWLFVGISRNDKELKDLDESDRKSTVFSGNLWNFRKIFPTNLFSEK